MNAICKLEIVFVEHCAPNHILVHKCGTLLEQEIDHPNLLKAYL